ncbi:MAG: transcriptional regulator [Chloroflexota bacterium]
MILAALPQAGGSVKNRPAVALRIMRPYGDMLVCGVSTQLRQMVPDFDEEIGRLDADFAESGLLADSIIRLGFLAVLPRQCILGSIGTISNERHQRLLHRLGAYLVEESE